MKAFLSGNRLLLGVLWEDVEVETEVEVENEEEVEGRDDRKRRKAGREMEAVACSVADFVLDENLDDLRVVVVGSVVVLIPPLLVLLGVWVLDRNLAASPASLDSSTSSSQVQPFSK